jgi:hypothetical protein
MLTSVLALGRAVTVVGVVVAVSVVAIIVIVVPPWRSVRRERAIDAETTAAVLSGEAENDVSP